MPVKLNRKRALSVLAKIDAILAWKKQKEVEPRYLFHTLLNPDTFAAPSHCLTLTEPEADTL
jgi:hypothetical protein